MTRDQIIEEFKGRAELLWKAAKQERKDLYQTAEYRGKAQAYDDIVDFLENEKWA